MAKEQIRVLVLDDDPQMQELLALFFAQDEYEYHRAKFCGAPAVIQKPFKPEHLQEAIDLALGRRPLDRPADQPPDQPPEQPPDAA